MANRKCSYCGTYYTDETGHDYDVCVKSCQERLAWTEKQLVDVKWALEEAKKVQAQDWWRKELARNNAPIEKK